MDSHTDKLVKSPERVIQHGEVFTPTQIVDSMLDQVKDESYKVESRFLEPSCGNGNFAVRILERKLNTVDAQINLSNREKNTLALYGLMSIYGIEYNEDNVKECRLRLIKTVSDFFKGDDKLVFCSAAEYVVSLNIVCGDTLKMQSHDGGGIKFSEWIQSGKDEFTRCEFLLTRLVEAGGDSILPNDFSRSITVEELALANLGVL